MVCKMVVIAKVPWMSSWATRCSLFYFKEECLDKFQDNLTNLKSQVNDFFLFRWMRSIKTNQDLKSLVERFLHCKSCSYFSVCAAMFLFLCSNFFLILRLVAMYIYIVTNLCGTKMYVICMLVNGNNYM